MSKNLYTPEDLITGPEAIKLLGLSKTDYLTWLVQRGLLSRQKFNRRSVKYFRKECQELFNRSIVEGINLLSKPTTKAA